MNILTSEMRRSLKELDLGLKGELTITNEMEELSQALFFDQGGSSTTFLNAAQNTTKTVADSVGKKGLSSFLVPLYYSLAFWATFSVGFRLTFSEGN